MQNICHKIQQQLIHAADPSFRRFHCRLIPTVDPQTVLGVRTPVLRSMAKALSADSEIESFLRTLPHRYYEENNLHCFLLAQLRDPADCLSRIDLFLPYVDNWATCDCLRPGCLRTAPELTYSRILQWIRSDKPYTVRYAVGLLEANFLDSHFDPIHPELVRSIDSDEYYVQMMCAWYFATALAKQWDAAYFCLQQKTLPPFVQKKAIQKALESRRVSQIHKDRLRVLRSAL